MVRVMRITVPTGRCSGSTANATMRSGGAHAHQMAGKVSTRVASQKFGVARPMMAMEQPHRFYMECSVAM